MAKGYWIAHVDVDDLEGYKAYFAANAEPSPSMARVSSSARAAAR